MVQTWHLRFFWQTTRATSWSKLYRPMVNKIGSTLSNETLCNTCQMLLRLWSWTNSPQLCKSFLTTCRHTRGLGQIWAMFLNFAGNGCKYGPLHSLSQMQSIAVDGTEDWVISWPKNQAAVDHRCFHNRLRNDSRNMAVRLSFYISRVTQPNPPMTLGHVTACHRCKALLLTASKDWDISWPKNQAAVDQSHDVPEQDVHSTSCTNSQEQNSISNIQNLHRKGVFFSPHHKM